MENTLRLLKNVSPTPFRAYDIRGIVDKDLSENFMYTLGIAIAVYVKSKDGKSITVACDGRLSSPVYKAALIKGILDIGIKVLDIDTLPTPLLYFAVLALSNSDNRSNFPDSGVMITGSHNSKEYNGLKIVVRGETLNQGSILAIRELINSGLESHITKYTLKNYREANIANRYLSKIINDIDASRIKLKVVIDAGNGVAGLIAPRLLRAINCEVVEMHCNVDGNFPNHHPDPSELKNMVELSQKVIEVDADIGFSFDGDGDRLGVVLKNGEIIFPDRQLMLLAEKILADNPASKIVYDVKSSKNLPKIIEKCGGQAIMWKTGHSLIKAKLKEEDAILAGEMSGHIFFNDSRWPYAFDDAIYAAARMLEAISYMLDKYDSVVDIFKKYPNSPSTPEIKIPISEELKFETIDSLIHEAKNRNFSANIITLDGLRIEFDNDAWGLVRASNTSPYLVLRFEADTQRDLEIVMDEFRKLLLEVNSQLTF